jgi:hypothetical protein
MSKRIHLFTVLLIAAGMAAAGGNASSDDARYCMDVNIEPFHMMPGFMDSAGACAVRDYWDGELQEAFYPFTSEDHLFNCEYFGDMAPLPTGDLVPSSVVSQDLVNGTIGGHPFSARLYCASLTNWYQESCADPEDPATCSVQLAQPFLSKGLPFPRVTEVSVIDGEIMVKRGRRTSAVPFLMATRAAGVTHIESMDPEASQVGASITHSALGMVAYGEDGDDARVLNGSLDLLLQGHIFYPGRVEDDPGAATVQGTICSKALYNMLNRRHMRAWGGRHEHHDDDD